MLKPSEIEQLLVQGLQPLEEERANLHQWVKRDNWIRKLVLAVVLLAGLYGTSFFGDDAFKITLGVWLTVAYLAISSSRKWLETRQGKVRDNFEQKVKKEVYEAVFKAWNFNSAYRPQQAIAEEDFKDGGLYWGHTHYSGQDYCIGFLADGRKFQFSNLTTYKLVKEKDEDGNYKSYEVPIFQGLFFVLENTLPYPNFDEWARITPDLAVAPSSKEKVKAPPPSTYYENILDADLEYYTPQEGSSEPPALLFDRLYTVANAEGTAPDLRAKLPSALTQQLSYFKSFYGQHFSIYFGNNKAYFASQQKVDFWQVPIETSLMDATRIKQLIGEFRTAFLLLEKIATTTHSTIA